MPMATRDPMHQSGAPGLTAHRDERIHVAPPKTAGVMSLLQLAGSFLAIPVALGSAYSVYNTNFSPDTQCQALRSSIISMIDKKIDAATRRMLVRRDVETFEKSCGAFDPDAKAAFMMLLQVGSRTVPVRPVAAPKVEAAKPAPVKVEAAKVETPKIEAPKIEAPAKEVARKVEPRPAAVAKPVPAEAEALDTAINDARWLEAVRGALISSEAAREAAALARARSQAEPPVLRTSIVPVAPALTAPAPSVPMAAPALPPAAAVVAPAEPRAAEREDRPVPPAAIPEPPPLDIARAANGPSWVSRIPFVGQVLDK